MKLKIISYNIHKGFQYFSKRYVLEEIRSIMRDTQAEIVFLQEVVGGHEVKEWSNQLEFLADSVWHHYSYGKNAIYDEGHHGNAILSKFAFSYEENHDLSLNALERRGLLHARISIPNTVAGTQRELDVFCTHLNLLEAHRSKQVKKICSLISERLIDPDAAYLLCGDFNDWARSQDRTLRETLKVDGVSLASFPSWAPLLSLDRIYSKGLPLVSAQVLTSKTLKKLSDHLPLFAEIDLGPFFSDKKA